MDDITRIFMNWPAAIPKEGTIVTAFGESIPFNDYLMTSELLLIIRPQPDGQGTRRVIMKLKDIIGIRIATTVEPERFTAMGFQRQMSAPRRPSAPIKAV
ncbi:MAG: hypothetical protein R3C59_11670 [Planctomycetaceae bacterium]